MRVALKSLLIVDLFQFLIFMLSQSLQARQDLLDNTTHLATGGTIDSHWNAAEDTAVPNPTSIIPAYFREALRLSLSSKTIFLKDSRRITRADKRSVVDAVTESNHRHTVVTSGTYLMPDIAKQIAHTLAQFQSNKRVVVTGSLTPIAGYSASDGGFNLGMCFALLDQKDLPGQAYLVMNGSCFHGDNVEKDLTSAQFGSTDGVDVVPYSHWTLISSGGSIDFELDGLDGLRPRRSSTVPTFLRDTVRTNKEFTAVASSPKDSREIEDAEINELLRNIRASKHDHIMITMGVYEMQKIAQALEDRLGESLGNKRILLTGSRVPLGLSDMSDAPFNLGYGLGKIGFLNPGVHVAVNGVVLPRQEDILKVMYTPEEIARIKADRKRSKPKASRA